MVNWCGPIEVGPLYTWGLIRCLAFCIYLSYFKIVCLYSQNLLFIFCNIVLELWLYWLYCLFSSNSSSEPVLYPAQGWLLFVSQFYIHPRAGLYWREIRVTGLPEVCEQFSRQEWTVLWTKTLQEIEGEGARRKIGVTGVAWKVKPVWKLAFSVPKRNNKLEVGRRRRRRRRKSPSVDPWFHLWRPWVKIE